VAWQLYYKKLKELHTMDYIKRLEALYDAREKDYNEYSQQLWDLEQHANITLQNANNLLKEQSQLRSKVNALANELSDLKYLLESDEIINGANYLIIKK